MKILAVLFQGFTAIDLVGPVNAWGLMPGVEFQTAWKVVGPVQTDVGLQMVATQGFADYWQAPDFLYVPGGGRGAIEALQDDALLDAIAAIGVRAGWVTSVCTGALLLGAAELLKGYRSACYWYARLHFEKFAAIPDEARYVIDRNRASGGGMTAGIDFALHTIGVLDRRRKRVADGASHGICPAASLRRWASRAGPASDSRGG
jgi:cyclohexyl-isocyanide hydratase